MTGPVQPAGWQHAAYFFTAGCVLFVMKPEEIPVDAEGLWFHGTTRRNARRILNEGLLDWSPTETTPMLKHLAKRGVHRYLHGGTYGRGTYVTRNWRTAMHFGPVLFGIEVLQGTRIVRIDRGPDPKVIDSLTREFGREILSKAPWKVIPRNKRLTLRETIELSRFHAADFQNSRWWERMSEMRNLLVRHGIHGWGDPEDLAGIVIFATDRLRVREVILSTPTEKLHGKFRETCSDSLPDVSLEMAIRACQNSNNRTAQQTLQWVADANIRLNNRGR